MKLYELKVRDLSIGSRIESFVCKSYLYNNKHAAFNAAYKLAQTHFSSLEEHEPCIWNPDGRYIDEDGNGYARWNAFETRISEVEVKVDQKNPLVYSTYISDYSFDR